MKKRFLCILLAISLLLCAVSCTKQEKPPVTEGSSDVTGQTEPAGQETLDLAAYNVISKAAYLDKTTGGFLAQLVGFLSGYEFAVDGNGNPRIAMPDSWFELCNGPYAEKNSRNRHEDKLLLNEQTGLWEVWNDDDFSIDILNQYILRDMYATYGTVVSKVITDDWVKYNVYDMGGGHRSYGAYGLAKNHGYLPPFLGNTEYGNLYSVNGEPYIENETLGMVAAGMPDLAADLAELFGSVTSERDPVIWLKYFATMYAMAYFETDIPTLMRQAEVVLPEDCWQREVIDHIFELYETYPDNWRSAVAHAEKECYMAHYDTSKPMGETSINCSFILIGLLYGGGDYYETCKIVSLAGHGGDSTTPVALGIVGIITGWDGLERGTKEIINQKIWQDGQGVIVNRADADVKSAYWMYCANLPERFQLTEIIDLYRQNFESILLENGGRIDEENYYVPKTALRSVDAVFTDDFESGDLAGWEKIGDGATFAQTAFMGKYAPQMNGDASHANGIYKTVSGLKVGETYRLTAFVSASTGTSAYLFAREVGASEYTFATVYDQKAFVKRNLVFTATAETMEVGILLPAPSTAFKYIVADDLQLIRVAETPVAKATITSTPQADGSYKNNIAITVEGSADREVLLKLTFANTAGKTVDLGIRLNNVFYATAPLYKTGKTISESALDTVYIPIFFTGETSNVVLSLGSASVYLRAAEVVAVADRFEQ